MRNLIIGSLLLLTSGCSVTIPSFYDDNTSEKVIDLVVLTKKLNCDSTSTIIQRQVRFVDQKLGWLQTYTEIKGSEDINAMLDKMNSTVEGLLKKDTISKSYCGIKKNLLTIQSERIAKAVMERY